METIQPIFYRNNTPLSFKVFDNLEDFKTLLPTIILFADKGEFIYQSYVFKNVQYVKDIKEITTVSDYYFILKHDIYDSDRLDKTMLIIEKDLSSGAYFPFGKINESPFKH